MTIQETFTFNHFIRVKNIRFHFKETTGKIQQPATTVCFPFSSFLVRSTLTETNSKNKLQSIKVDILISVLMENSARQLIQLPAVTDSLTRR